MLATLFIFDWHVFLVGAFVVHWRVSAGVFICCRVDVPVDSLPACFSAGAFSVPMLFSYVFAVVLFCRRVYPATRVSACVCPCLCVCLLVCRFSLPTRLSGSTLLSLRVFVFARLSAGVCFCRCIAL